MFIFNGLKSLVDGVIRSSEITVRFRFLLLGLNIYTLETGLDNPGITRPRVKNDLKGLRTNRNLCRELLALEKRDQSRRSTIFQPLEVSGAGSGASACHFLQWNVIA